MKITEQEAVEVKNLMKIIRRASFENFQGLEALALSRAYSWLDSLVRPQPNPIALEPIVPSNVTELPKAKSRKK